jgi:uncharacterized membrane protein YgcG
VLLAALLGVVGADVGFEGLQRGKQKADADRLHRRGQALIEQRHCALETGVRLRPRKPFAQLRRLAPRLVEKVPRGFSIFGPRLLRRDGDPPLRQPKRIKRCLLLEGIPLGVGWRQMRLDPGVRRPRTFVPFFLWHGGENEFVTLTTRAAAQALFVPVDPNIPVLFRWQGGLEISPGGACPLRRASRPKRQVGCCTHAARRDALDITPDRRPGGCSRSGRGPISRFGGSVGRSYGGVGCYHNREMYEAGDFGSGGGSVGGGGACGADGADDDSGVGRGSRSIGRRPRVGAPLRESDI